MMTYQTIGNGVIKIEAGGNGSVNLSHPDFKAALNPAVKDSDTNLAGALCLTRFRQLFNGGRAGDEG